MKVYVLIGNCCDYECSCRWICGVFRNKSIKEKYYKPNYDIVPKDCGRYMPEYFIEEYKIIE